jgi:hypothetical protein
LELQMKRDAATRDELIAAMHTTTAKVRRRLCCSMAILTCVRIFQTCVMVCAAAASFADFRAGAGGGGTCSRRAFSTNTGDGIWV